MHICCVTSCQTKPDTAYSSLNRHQQVHLKHPARHGRMLMFGNHAYHCSVTSTWNETFAFSRLVHYSKLIEGQHDNSYRSRNRVVDRGWSSSTHLYRYSIPHQLATTTTATARHLSRFHTHFTHLIKVWVHCCMITCYMLHAASGHSVSVRTHSSSVWPGILANLIKSRHLLMQCLFDTDQGGP